MRTSRQFLVTVILLLILTVDGASIQATPRSITMGDATSLTLRCTADMSQGQVSKIFSIQIQKKVNNQVRLLAGVDLDGSPKLKDTSLTQRAMVTGSVGTGSNVVSGSYLQLVLTKIVCQDSGQYCCSLSGQDGGGTNIILKDSTNVTTSGQPENIKMFISPDSVTYSANQFVSIRCTGKVGAPAKRWFWEWKNIGSITWTSYPRTDQIKDEDPSFQSTGCWNNYEGVTRLSYVARVEDNGRIIRCSVERNGTYSANKTIYIAGQNGGESEKARSGKIVMIIGITIGLIMNNF